MKFYSANLYNLVVAIFFFFSCVEQKKETNGEISILKEMKLNEVNFSLNASIVKLETTDSCLLGNIMQIEKDDSTIFIFDTYKKVYAFDCKGNFLNTIGRNGKLPESYLSCSFFYLDKKKKLISIVDDMRFEVLTYTYDGKYISSKEIQSPEEMKWCSKGILGEDGNLFVFRTMNWADNFQYALFDTQNSFTSLWKRYTYDPIRPKDHGVDFSNHPMVKMNDGIHFIVPLCDTVFQYYKGDIKPIYIVELPQPILPKKLFTEELTTRKSYFSMVNDLAGDTYFSGFTGLYETSTHLLLKYKNRYVDWYYLADKKEGKGFFQPFSMSSNLENIPFWDILSSTEDEFIGAINCETLLDAEKDVDDKSIIHPELKKIMTTSKFDDNPCLVFYHF